MKRNIVLIPLLLLLISCKDSNVRLEKYTIKTTFNENHFFSIDSTLTNNIYLSQELTFYNDSIYPAKFEFWVRENKFYAKLLKPISQEFVLFDLNSKLNEVNKIKIKNIKSFDCILENKITTKEKLDVQVFRIKKWGRLPDFFGGSEIDIVVFVTKKNGVIGSYFSDTEQNGNKVMFGISGDVFKEYIDYSKIREVELL